MSKLTDDIRKYEIYLGETFLDRLIIPLTGLKDKERNDAVRENRERAKCVAFAILLTKEHTNHIVVSKGVGDMIEKFGMTCTLKTGRKYLNKMMELGLIEYMFEKNGMSYWKVASFIDADVDGRRVKSKQKRKVCFTEYIKPLVLAKKVFDCAVSIYFYRTSKAEKRLKKGCLTMINREKPYKEGSIKDPVLDRAMVTLSHEVWDIMEDRYREVPKWLWVTDMKKKHEAWKFALVNWLRRRINEMIASRSWEWLMDHFGLSRNALARTLRALKATELRVQHNHRDISEDEEFCLRAMGAKVYIFTTPWGLAVRTRNSYSHYGMGWTEIKKWKKGTRIHAEVELEVDSTASKVKEIKSDRWYYLAAHPEVRRAIAVVRRRREAIYERK